jgi:hypothetical protein
MSDVNFRNLKEIPLQDGFTQSSVIKISAASKIFAAAVGIISICAFVFTDSAKTSITTIETTNSQSNCRILSTFSSSGLTLPVTVAEGATFRKEFVKLLKSLPGTQNTEINSPDNLIPDIVSRLGYLQGTGYTYPLTYNQAYFPNYQSCLDAFMKPPVCVYENDFSTNLYKDQPIPPVYGVTWPNYCSSYLSCLWSDAPKVKELQHGMQIILNVTAFNCNPTANFTTCFMISSACPEYARYAVSIGKLLTTHIATPERLCTPFKDLPPYSCQTFQVASPIQVISQTLSLMATALGGCEVFLYFVLTFKHKYQSLAKVHSDSDTQPEE